MIRRARIALISAIVLFALVGFIIGAVFMAARTALGRDYVRRLVMSIVKQGVHGSVYVGHITGDLLTGVTIDSLAIRDPDDSLFVSSGPVTLRYDVRDLLDRRILLRGVHAEHPLVYIRQHEDGQWNFQTIFPSHSTKPRTPGRGFGDYVVIDSAVVRNATFWLTLPWHVSPTLHGAARDSAIRFELHRKDHEIRRTRDGFARTWRWTGGNATLVHGRVNDPDSTDRLFVVRDVSVNEADPPFLFHNASATMRQRGDSIWIESPHCELPASVGKGHAKIWWGSNLPVRYAIHIISDSVSMRDIAWIYPTLPHTGSGHAIIDIGTEPKHLRLIDYAVSNMDAHSTRSHLTGRMTFTLGEDTLIVKDVQLAASPVNFDLLRTLNGKPFPYNWQGDITGIVRASGGNLGRFKVEDAQFTFADANVPGAITRGSAKGELNIYTPALTEFHDFAVNAQTLDLRTLQFLNKEFPRLHGTVSGTAVLDSSWMDVRFHDGDILHHDGTAPVSHVTGNGRVTWGAYMTYDLDLQAQPVSFTALRQSYSALPLHGQFSGPVRVQGQSPDLHVEATLTGDAGEGRLSYVGQVDADPPVYGARGVGSFTNADMRLLLDRPDLAKTVVSGMYAVDLTGDTLPHLTGSAAVALAPSTLGAIQVDSSVARVHFDSGLVHVDSLALLTSAGRVDAHGTIGLADDRPGSLLYTASLTSLAEANQLFGNPLKTPLVGSATLAGTLSGTPSNVALTGTVHGHGLSYGSSQAQRVSGSFTLADLTHTPSGTLLLSGDSLLVGAFPLDSLSAAIHLVDAHHADFSARFAGQGALRGATVGHVAMQSPLTTVQIDTANLVSDSSNTYRLAAPFRIVADTHTVAVDSLLFMRRSGGLVALRDMRFSGDSIQGSLRTSGFSLALLELFTTKANDLSGGLSANVEVHGTTAHPQVSGAMTVNDGSAYIPGTGTRLEHINADIALDGDTVRVRKLSAETNKERRGTVDASGTIAVAHYDNPVFDLRATATNLRAIDKRGLASLDVSTVQPLTLTGPYRNAVVHGGIRVEDGTIYIPELIKKRVVDLSDTTLATVLDTTVAQNRALLPQAPSDFTKNLRLENVAIHIGDDVWLRSAEANIKLGGSLSVTLSNNTHTGASQLALEGDLSADRGTYRLNVVPLVQPVFDVEKGTLRFYGTSDLDPALNITAINTVRQPQQSVNGQDVRIRVTIGGTLSAPTLTLSSADNLPLTQSDLLSYLVTGQPAFALDYTTQQYVDQLASAVIRSAGSVISSAIPKSVFDVVDLQTPSTLNGTVAQQQGLDSQTLYNLLNTRAVLGKQLNDKLFLNFTTGFCAENFRNNLGLRFEYRLNQMYTMLLGLEPGSSDLACARNGVAPSIQQTPPQFGFDLFRAWRF